MASDNKRSLTAGQKALKGTSKVTEARARAQRAKLDEHVQARQQQAAIIKLLLSHGARPTDKDSQGKTVKQAATSLWIRELLSETKVG